MWYIRNAQGGIIYLKPNKLMIVSRKAGNDIVLKDDTSISKLHATIIVRPKINFKENEPSSIVTIQDTQSKYGTFIINSNNQQRKLAPGDHTLNVTDKVKFGLQNHVFTLHYVPFIVSTSSLNANENTELKNILNTSDGVITDKWKEYCTHLTVSNVKLTAQVVQALAFGTPIVTLKYWRTVLGSVETNAKLPDVTNFIPLIEEGLINKESVSLETNPERKVLFKNLCFVCFSSTQYQLKDIIRYAGGKVKLFQEGQTDVRQLSSENIIVLQREDDSSQPLQISIDTYDSIQKALQEKNLRLIPESEISLAILYCSTEKYCNPKFKFKKLVNVGRNSNKNRLLSTIILAPDTQDILGHTSKKTPVIIKETITLSERMENYERDSRKEKPSKQTNANTLKESSLFRLGSKKSVNKPIVGSEESSREGCLVIDETGSGSDSDSNDRRVRRNFVNEFDGIMDNSKLSSTTDRPTSSRFNLQMKSQTSGVHRKENLNTNEVWIRNSSKKSDDDLVSNPSTSKDVSSKRSLATNRSIEEEESSAQKRFKISSVQKTSSSANETDNRKASKRDAKGEENMFSFANEEAKRKKTTNGRDDANGLFKFERNQNVKTLPREENIFEKDLVEFKTAQKKRRRPGSVSSDNASSSGEEKPKIKIERLDGDDEVYMPFIRIKKEDTSMDESYKSTILPLLRTDVDLTMDHTIQRFKKFVKVYTSIPLERIKMKNLYVWKPEEGSVTSNPRVEESASSEDGDDDFNYYDKIPAKKIRAKK